MVVLFAGIATVRKVRKFSVGQVKQLALEPIILDKG